MKQFEVKQYGKSKEVLQNDVLQEEVKTLEECSNIELNEYEQAFKEQKKKEQKQIKDATSTGFWFAAYFADVEQCQEFLKNAGLQPLMEGQYIRGDMMAKKMGVNVTKKKMKVPPSFRKHKDFSDMCM